VEQSIISLTAQLMSASLFAAKAGNFEQML